jgi:hypothetical protein
VSDEKYEGWTNWDTWATWLVLTNTEQSQKWLENWSKNFQKKIKQGKFDMEKAEKVVKKYLIPSARGKGSWAKVFMKNPYNPLVPEPDIDPKKVNAREIVKAILDLTK